MKKFLCMVTVLSFILTSLFIPQVEASVPYESYTYNYWLDPVKSPHAYIPKNEWTGNDLGVGDFNAPSDLYTTSDGYLYVVDTNNNRIVWFDSDFQFVDQIDTFNNGDTFNLPQGIYVTEEKHIYVADTENQRIVEFDKEKQFVREITRPKTELITDSTSFRPTKVVVDKAGRIYTLAIGINSGIVELNVDGSFQGFLGASEVSINPLSYVWRRYFATEDQKSRMQLIIPTEYNSLFLDKEEFIYVTMGNVKPKDYGIDVIRRLNPTGVNVIRDFGYGSPIGDYYFNDVESITKFNDISVNDTQLYTALDGVNGKLFSYDYDGNLLYVFGGKGDRTGNFMNAVALEQFANSMYVLDAGKNSITVFERTKYGQLVQEAIGSHYNGNYDESFIKWKEVLKYNANSDMAYIGLGKVYLRNGEYKKAMDYFKLANNRKYYSKAFTDYRREFLGDKFSIIMTTGLLLIVCFIIGKLFIRRWKKLKNRRKPLNEYVLK